MAMGSDGKEGETDRISKVLKIGCYGGLWDWSQATLQCH